MQNKDNHPYQDRPPVPRVPPPSLLSPSSDEAPMTTSNTELPAVGQSTEVATVSSTPASNGSQSSRNAIPEPVLDSEGHNISRFRPNIPSPAPKLPKLNRYDEADFHRRRAREDHKRRQREREMYESRGIRYDENSPPFPPATVSASEPPVTVPTTSVVDMSSQQAFSPIDTTSETLGASSSDLVPFNDTAMQVDYPMSIDTEPLVPVHSMPPVSIQPFFTPPTVPAITFTGPTPAASPNHPVLAAPPQSAPTFTFGFQHQPQASPVMVPGMWLIAIHFFSL